MDKVNKMNLLKSKGYTYEPVTGKIFRKGKEHKTVNDRYKCIRIMLNGKIISVYHHQFAYWFVYGEIVDCVDHINRNKMDNRICNLRSVTHKENAKNTNPGKGCSYHKRLDKFQARIRINGRLKALGYFKTEKEARDAYLKARKEYGFYE